MYNLVTVKDTVRIPPRLFSKVTEDAVIKTLKEQYEGKVDKNLGIIIAVTNPRDVSKGKVIPGDGAAYHSVVFDAVTFKPEVHEVIRARVSDITEFGAFLRFGPVDGLVHVSQVTDDFVSYNNKTQSLTAKNTKRVLKKEDEVLARIIAVSMKDSMTDIKMNLTMRQTGLGKKEWLSEKPVKTGKQAKAQAEETPAPEEKAPEEPKAAEKTEEKTEAEQDKKPVDKKE